LISLIQNNEHAKEVLDTKLFKPSNSVDLHRPVHKIISEYGAANYLTKLISNTQNSHNINKVLAVMAPNSAVRDELRGLLGWMAALGNQSIQETVIKLDPYAVLANGDPSQLTHSSKKQLINRLKEIEEDDPYFRRGDFWRTYSVAGFFTPDVLDLIKPILQNEEGGHLQGLVLEMLNDQSDYQKLYPELRSIALNSTKGITSRLLASKYLNHLDASSLMPDLNKLLEESSHESLRIVAETIESREVSSFSKDFIKQFLEACSTLYPDPEKRYTGVIGERLFIRYFIQKLDQITTKWLLDQLTLGITCNCENTNGECQCLNGTSKVVGHLLDRYLEIAIDPLDPAQVWSWLKNLYFDTMMESKDSQSVQMLQENDELRQSILRVAFGNLTSVAEIKKLKFGIFGWNRHSGLNFQNNDIQFVIDYAFDSNNSTLWASFLVQHQYHLDDYKNSSNSELRRHVRHQANRKPSFMREWVKFNSAAKSDSKYQQKKWGDKRNRRKRKRIRKSEELNHENILFVQQNKELVESGEHWNCLVQFANLVLNQTDQIIPRFGDEGLVRKSLRNCIAFITPDIPSLEELAENRCESKVFPVERILYASCLEIMRSDGNLQKLDISILRVLKTGVNMHYRAVTSVERENLAAEVDRIIFSSQENAEEFLRNYLEPQLENTKCKYVQISLLRDLDVYTSLRAELSVEWLNHYADLKLETLDQLFEVAVEYGCEEYLRLIIQKRCEEYLETGKSCTTKGEEFKKFWLIRGWFFLQEESIIESCWDFIKLDKHNLLTLSEQSGIGINAQHSLWPKLTPHKVGVILHGFIDQWPKVTLPNHWGTGSPTGEDAYRFLTDSIQVLYSEKPSESIPVLERLLGDKRFTDFHKSIKSIYSVQLRKEALIDFMPPTVLEINSFLNDGEVVTVEGLRKLILEELHAYQKEIKGGEFNTGDRFYETGKRLGEVNATIIIAERMNLRLQHKNISIILEHQLKEGNRADFTAVKMIQGQQKMLVTEVKGQWHQELYQAAETQLNDRYAIHPNAEQQGIYLVLWFGPKEKVANRISHDINSAQHLKKDIEIKMPNQLNGYIDVFVLDVSK